MPGLLELQRAMRTAILTGIGAPPSALGGTLDAAARVRIYRNNVLGNLTGALRLTFPAVERLVGGDFFAGAAARFVAATPPVSADLYEYGAAFPDFLGGLEQARGIAYLPDVARLEWAVGHALHATVVPAVTADELAAIFDAPEGCPRLYVHPSLSLLALTYPAKAIWEAVLTPDADARASALAEIDMTAEGGALAVLNGSNGLALVALPPVAFAFARALADGQGLTEALDLVPPPEAAAVLGGLIANGFFGCGNPTDGLNEKQTGWNR